MSLKTLLLGKSRSLTDQNLFHKISLVAILAWVGLGADGLSSSCYGPEETFKALGANPHLALFVALASVVTIVAICASYSQIISLFPTGGGYLVASKLLAPWVGVVSGSALLIDYVLTITISVASGADALFSLMPPAWLDWHPTLFALGAYPYEITFKLLFALGVVIGLTLVNLRGVKESVMLWVIPFFIFVFSHGFVIVYAIITHAGGLGAVAAATTHEVHTVSASVGWFGLMAVLLKAYSMGAGTYTGIEAVSNGLPILREPRVKTGRRTMIYMGTSLALTVAGLLLAYMLYAVQPVEGQTLNSVLVKTMTASWNHLGGASFVWITLASEAALLLIAAQTGFLDGPRVLANMALDRWFPSPFANLSDRLVTQNGLVLMGLAAFAMMAFTRGSVDLLVVLYSINVFITFSLSQLGMVIHWWRERAGDPTALRKLAINGFGFGLTFCILVALSAEKFFEGGWVTIVITAILVAAAFSIKRHYVGVHDQLRRLDAIVEAAEHGADHQPVAEIPEIKTSARTAILLVNGYNGLGLHTLLHVPRMFGDAFRNLVFIQVGAVDAGNFKGAGDIGALRAHTAGQVECYVQWARRHGYGTDAFTAIGRDVIGEAMKLAGQAREKFPNSVFFAGQLLFARETWVNRFLHNHTAFALQRRFYLASLPFVILPIRVETSAPTPAET